MDIGARARVSQASSANEAVSFWRYRLPDLPSAATMTITVTVPLVPIGAITFDRRAAMRAEK